MEDNREVELKVALNASQQAKLKLPVDKIGEVAERLKEGLKLRDFTFENRRIFVEDEYFDTQSLSLFAASSSLRKRREGTKTVGCYKQLVKSTNGVLDRAEFEEEMVAHDGWPNKIQFAFQKKFPQIPIATVNCVLRAESIRYKLLAVSGDVKFEFSIDEVKFYGPKLSSGIYHEMEIEAKSEAAEERLPELHQKLAEFLKGDLIVAESKYETGVRELGLVSRFSKNRLFSAIRADKNLGVWGFILGVIAFPLGVLAWIFPDFWK